MISLGVPTTDTYLVTSSGDVSLSGIVAVDDRLGEVDLRSSSLVPEAWVTGILTYVVVEGDLPGPPTNRVVVSGTPALVLGQRCQRGRTTSEAVTTNVLGLAGAALPDRRLRTDGAVVKGMILQSQHVFPVCGIIWLSLGPLQVAAIEAAVLAKRRRPGR